MKRTTIISLALLIAAVVMVYFSLSPFTPKPLDVSSDPVESASQGIVQEKRTEEVGSQEEKIVPVFSDQSPLEFTPISDDLPKQPVLYQYWHDAQAILRASYRAEDLVVAAIYDQVMDPELGGNNIQLAEDSLFSAYHLDYTNPLVNHQIMLFCSRNPESTICSLPYDYNLMQTDGENATILNELSTVYYRNYDFHQALYLLNKAALVEHSDNYYGRYIVAIDNALTYNGIRFMRTRENLSLYPKLAAAGVRANFSNIIKMCDERIGLQLEQWRIAFRDAGKNIADRSINTISEGFGVRQYVRYAGINLKDQEAAIQAVAYKRKKIAMELEDESEVANKQIPYRVWEAFVNDLRDKGEGEAYENLEKKMSVFQKYLH